MSDQKTPNAGNGTHPADNGTTVTGLHERSAILCRTCLSPLTWETRTEPGYAPRTGFYDEGRIDPLVCYKAVSYRHEPLTDREWAYYSAGFKAGQTTPLTPEGSAE